MIMQVRDEHGEWHEYEVAFAKKHPKGTTEPTDLRIYDDPVLPPQETWFFDVHHEVIAKIMP